MNPHNGNGETAATIFAVLAFPAPLPHTTWWVFGAALAWAGLIAFSAREGWDVAVRVASIAGLGMALRISLPEYWPGLVPLVAAFGIVALLSRNLPVLRPLTKPPAGSLDTRTLWMIGAVVVIASAGLVTWVAVVGSHAFPESTRFAIRQARGHPLWVLVPVGVLFALVNAAAEEVFFRGAFMAGLTEVVGIGAALPIQAVSFGAFHLHGFPSGVSGIVLAAVYGLMLGALRIRSRGLLAPWIAHVFADLLIAAVAIHFAR